MSVHGDGQLPGEQLVRRARRADDRRRVDPGAVEADLGEAPGEVERVELGDRDAGGVGGDERLGRAVRRGARDEQPRRRRRRPARRSSRRSARGRRRRVGAAVDAAVEPTAVAGAGHRPRRGGLARQQRRRGPRPARSSLPARGQGVGDDVGPDERARLQPPAARVGDQRGVERRRCPTRCRRRATPGRASSTSRARPPAAGRTRRTRRPSTRRRAPPAAGTRPP